MPDAITIGEAIRVCREKRNLTVDQLGALIGRSGITVARYENGFNRPPPRVVTLISQVLRVDLSTATTNDTETDTRARFVAERAAQGFGPTVTDPIVLAAVAAILRTAAANTERPAT